MRPVQWIIGFIVYNCFKFKITVSQLNTIILILVKHVHSYHPNIFF